jgi:hypothetical protein
LHPQTRQGKKARHTAERGELPLIDDIFRVIDTRSFASVWYWIIIALFWSNVTQNILGAPHALILRARRHGGDALEDMETLVGVTIRRRLRLMDQIGHWIVGFVLAILSLVGALAFVYRLEFAQAVFLLLLPLSILRLMGLRVCYRIERQNLRGDQLVRALLRHRLGIQFLGMGSIFVTAIWGMFRIMSASILY